MASQGILRRAQPGDYARVIELFAELGVDDPSPAEAVWVARLMPTTLVLELLGQCAGYAYYDLLPDTGYVRNLVVAPRRRGQGHGHALMNALARVFGRAGCREWRLNVKPDNAAAVALYRAMGLKRAYDATCVSLPRSAIARLPAAPAAFRAGSIEPGDDATLERRFAMPRGLLAWFRGRDGQRLWQLCDDGSPDRGALGVARFNADLFGAFPFRLERPGLARPLIEAMLAAESSQRSPVLLNVEDDAELVAQLRVAGGQVEMATWHMVGPLPRAPDVSSR